MAFYEFECEKCHKHFTVKQSYTEHDRNPRPKCPSCGSTRVGQLIASVHVMTSKKS